MFIIPFFKLFYYYYYFLLFYVFMFDSFNYAPVFCVLLFACTSHLMLYTAPHNEYTTCQPLFSTICIYSSAMSLCTYYARVVLVGHTIVAPNKSDLILSPSYVNFPNYQTSIIDKSMWFHSKSVKCYAC